jgi:hypothetical protein
MRTTVVLLFTLLPIGALAGQYSCVWGKGARETIEASSTAEAEYKVRQQYPQRRWGNCWNAVESSDIFVRDTSFANNKQLRPYIPSNLKPSGKAGYRCNTSGGFKADNDPDGGWCVFYVSSSPAAEWRIRFVKNGAATKVWRMTLGAWEPWVELGEPPNVYHVVSISPQAQQYAASNGAGQQPTSSQGVNQTDNSALTSPISGQSGGGNAVSAPSPQQTPQRSQNCKGQEYVEWLTGKRCTAE